MGFEQKVYVYENGQFTALPNLDDYISIGSIEHEYGSNDRVYIGTNVGVFYIENGMSEWVLMDGLPHNMTNDLAINYCSGKLIAGVFGRGVWSCDLIAPNTSPKSITASEVIANRYNQYNDIIIEPGATLTVTGKLHMADGTKLIVRPGARLIVDGGTLTGQCGMWDGVEVQGISTASQYSTNGVLAQGYAEFKNGAIVERARNAVSNWEANNWNSTGGIIIADHATFRNNWRAVQMMKYQNFNSSGNAPDRSRFNQCDFETNDALPDGEEFYAFITMFTVDDIKITGCDFTDARSGLNDLTELGHGIIATDAKFTVKAQCLNGGPCDVEANLDRSTFTGLQTGVWATHINGTKTFVVDQCQFTGNIIGVLSEAVNDITVIRNKLNVGGNIYAGPGPIKQEGIVINGGTRYHVEGNDLVAFAPSTYTTIGVRVSNTGGDANQIYRNAYDGFTVGNLSNYLNGDPDDPFNGLQFLCNDHQSDVFDIAVTGVNPSDGILASQGTNSSPSGNLFSLNGNNPASDYNNETANNIDYFHGNSSLEIPVNVLNVNQINTNEIRSCPIEIEGDEPTGPTKNSMMVQELETHQTAYNSLTILHDDLIDGGSTVNLTSDVTNAWPEDTWALRTNLLSKSPHLSKEVLQAAALRTDVLPHAVLFEILAANPDVVRNPGFQQFLRNKQDPMPEYMIQLLASGSGQSTYRTVLESEIAYRRAQMSNAIHLLTLNLHRDSTGLDTLAYDTLLQANHTLLSEISRIEAKVEKGQFQSGLQAVDQLLQEHHEDATTVAELTEYRRVLTVLKSARENGRTLLELNPQEIAELQAVAQTSNQYAGIVAKNALRFANGEEHRTLPLLPSGVGDNTASAHFQPQQWSLNTGSFEAHPNPAKQWTAFSWELPESESGTLTIRSIEGKVIKTVALQQKQGQWVWNIDDVPAGIYLCTLETETQFIRTLRMIVD